MKLKLLLAAIAATSLFSSLSYAMTLKEAFQQAQRTNPTILSAQHREAAQESKVSQERAAYLPSIDVYSRWGKEKSRNSTVAGRNSGDEDALDTLTRNENRVVLKQLIFDGFETPNRVAASEADSLAETQGMLNIQEAVFINVVEVYLDTLRHQSLLKHARNYVKAQKSIAYKVEDRASTGYGDKADQLQASSRLRLARAELRQIERNIAITEASFESVVGVKSQDLSMPDMNVNIPEALDAAIQQAIANHPAMKMATARKEASEKSYDASQGTYWPEFGLELAASKNRNMDGSKGPNDDYSAMLTMNYNLFRGGADKARRMERAEQMNQSMQQYQETLRKIQEDVSRSWFALTAAQDRVKEINGYADEREQVKQLFVEQYEVGRRSLLNLLDSEQESFNARKLQVNEQYSAYLEKYRLLNSMGSLSSQSKI